MDETLEQNLEVYKQTGGGTDSALKMLYLPHHHTSYYAANTYLIALETIADLMEENARLEKALKEALGEETE